MTVFCEAPVPRSKSKMTILGSSSMAGEDLVCTPKLLVVELKLSQAISEEHGNELSPTPPAGRLPLVLQDSAEMSRPLPSLPQLLQALADLSPQFFVHSLVTALTPLSCHLPVSPSGPWPGWELLEGRDCDNSSFLFLESRVWHSHSSGDMT